MIYLEQAFKYHCVLIIAYYTLAYSMVKQQVFLKWDVRFL